MTRDQILIQALARLPAPTVLLAPTQVTYRLDGADKGRIDERAAIEAGYGKAVRITTRQRATAEWEVKAVIDIDNPVSKGDVMLMVFRVRNPSAAAGADARTQLVIERGAEPHDRLAAYPVNITGNWVLHYVPFEARSDFSAGEWSVNFFAGYAPQAFELTDVRLLHFGNQVSSKELPRIRRTYAGIARDAAWRAEAAARIDRIRKADLSVTVVDCAGNPVSGAEVDIAMTRHAFLFGSAVVLQWLGDLGNPDHNVYRQHIEQLFNHVVNENDLKWPQWSGVRGPDWSQERSLTALRWLKERGFHTKGHCIIWPSWWGTIPSLREAADNPDAMRTIIAERIRDLVTRAGPFIDEWDVINEPFTNNDVMKVLGNEAMIDWFKQTREHTADARLYLNDYDILASGGETDTAHQQHVEESLRYLIDGEAPIGGIGMQSHFGENVTPPATLWKILDRFATFNLPIQITEFDLNTEDEKLQANYTRDFMTAVFAHEAINGFVMWGF